MNLLAHRIVDIVLEEGARFSVPEEEGGRGRVETALAEVLQAREVDPSALTVQQLRHLYHDGWSELLDRVCPSDTHARVTERFYQLVFT